MLVVEVASAPESVAQALASLQNYLQRGIELPNEIDDSYDYEVMDLPGVTLADAHDKWNKERA